MNERFFQLRRAYIKESMGLNVKYCWYNDFTRPPRYGHNHSEYYRCLDAFNLDIHSDGYVGRLKMLHPNKKLEDIRIKQMFDVMLGGSPYGKLVGSFYAGRKDL